MEPVLAIFPRYSVSWNPARHGPAQSGNVQIEANIASQANFTTASSCVFVTDEDAPLPQHLSRGSATEGRVDE